MFGHSVTYQQINTIIITLIKSITKQLLINIPSDVNIVPVLLVQKYYCCNEPCKVKFSSSFAKGVNETILNGFFPDTWLLGST